MSIFILSPANLGGAKAERLLDPDSRFPTALKYQSAQQVGMSIAEVFTYLSSLYFRGKITYALRFASRGIYVIAPGFGLVPPDWKFTRARALKMRDIPVDTGLSAYRRPFEEDAGRIARELGPRERVVFLGSLARRKYLEVLGPAFGNRLYYPEEFKSMGDMKRGALMLQAVRSGVELRYERAPVL